jgi:hypothetical protein
MSRCQCCDKRLSDYELTLRHSMTNEFMDTCMDCLSEISETVPMMVKGRKDLLVSIEDPMDSRDNEIGLDKDEEL